MRVNEYMLAKFQELADKCEMSKQHVVRRALMRAVEEDLKEIDRLNQAT